ncbi:hypothetical protein [Oceanirhabdus seepicola]|uniref:Uncharacterized protein n=1 Tax=Oceanirhabdus seepicola TaxID=2828781 RepID=A0A9J6P260_9CLOT|nr:hypothetical protein [Oceanirhabdus seepicola]MCM1990603.1 hypothetical protein [Oceanirhabdus seepicola]
MSQFYYIASPRKLDIGTFGTKKVDVEEVEIISTYKILVNSTREIECEFPIYEGKSLDEVKKGLMIYDTEEDAKGIYIGELSNGAEMVKHHFTNEFVYDLAPVFGNFDCSYYFKGNYGEGDRYNKCFKVLFEYIRERLNHGEFIEVFASWADEEKLDRKVELDRDIFLNDEISYGDFQIKDRQYTRFFL